MKRSLPLIALLSCIVLGIVLLLWFGGIFQKYLGTTGNLVVHAPLVQRLPLGSDVKFQLDGSGFDRDTRVSLVLDVSNQDSVVNRYPLDGYYNSSLIVGDFLLLGSNDGLKLISLSVPDSPRILETYLPGRSVVDLHYGGGKVFVSCGRLGLVVMDLQENGLRVEAEVWTGDTIITSYFHAGYLYVNNLSGSLLVYDASDSARFRQVGQLHHATTVRGMDFSGNQLFLYDRSGILYLYDCSDPTALSLIDQLRFESVVRAILVKNTVLYVALTDSLWAFELGHAARLGQLELLKVWDQFGSIMRLIGGENHLYLIDRSVGVRIFDTRDLTMSEQKSFAEGLQTLAENGDYLYCTGSLEGLLTIDRRQLRSRQVVKWIGSLPGVIDGIVVDGFFYLSFNRAGVGGVAIVDQQKGIATPFADAPAPSSSLARYQNLLFVRQMNSGVRVFDMTIRTSPQLLAEWPDYEVNRLLVINDYLISYSLRNGLQVTAVADIGAARVVDQVEAPQIVSMVAVNDYLLGVTYDQGLLIYRVHDSGKLEKVNRFRPPFPAQLFDQQVDIHVQDGLAYIANGRSGLLIVDVSDPTNLQLVGTITPPGYAKGVRFHQNLVFLVTLRNGVHLVDVTRPAQPLLIGTIPLSRLSKFLLIDDGLLYFFQDASGISAIPLPVFAKSVRLRSRNRLNVTIPAPLYPGRYNLLVSNHHGTVTHNGVFDFYQQPE